MPAPPAAFSPLAITRSARARAASARTCRRTRSRPGRPTMSPMKSSFIRAGWDRRFDRHRCSPAPRRSVIRGSTTRSSPFASRARAFARVDRRVDAHRAREAAEVALDQVKAGRSALGEIGPFLLADDRARTPALNRMRIASAGTPGTSSTISTVFSVSNTSTSGMHSPATTCRRSGRRLARSSNSRRTSWARSAGSSPSSPRKTRPFLNSNGGSGIRDRAISAGPSRRTQAVARSRSRRLSSRLKPLARSGVI